MEQTYLQLLRENREFQAGFRGDITYEFCHEENDRLCRLYDVEKAAGTEEGLSDLKRAENLLVWLNGHVKHDGCYGNAESQDAITLLNLAYDNRMTGINCLALAVILSECCLAVRMPARVVYMMPYDAADTDNHVVTEVWIRELGKWVMLDPTYGCYCLSKENVPLHLLEIRERLCNGDGIYFSGGLNYNGERGVDREDICEYYAKNLFFLRVKHVQSYGSHITFSGMLEIAPEHFDVHTRMTENLKYRISRFGICDVLKNWLAYETEGGHTYMAPERIYLPPSEVREKERSTHKQ